MNKLDKIFITIHGKQFDRQYVVDTINRVMLKFVLEANREIRLKGRNHIDRCTVSPVFSKFLISETDILSEDLSPGIGAKRKIYPVSVIRSIAIALNLDSKALISTEYN